MHLGERRGDAHGNIHHCAQCAYDDTADQKSLKSDGRAGLTQLQKRLNIGKTQAAYSCKLLRKQAEQQCDSRTGDRAEHGTDALASRAAENDHRDYGYVCADEKHREQRGGALNEQWYQKPKQAGKRDGESDERFCADSAANEHRDQDKCQGYYNKYGHAVILVHRCRVAAVGVGGYKKRHAVADLDSAAVKRADIVADLQGLALVLACFYLGKQKLLATQCIVRRGVGECSVRQDIRHNCIFILGIVTVGRRCSVLGCSDDTQYDKKHERRRKHDNTHAVILEPLFKISPRSVHFHPKDPHFILHSA